MPTSAELAVHPVAEPDGQDLARRRAWRVSLGFATAGTLLSIVLLHATASSLVALWVGHSTYNHALLILPITAYIIWRMRGRVAGLTPSGSFAGVLATFLFAVIWLISDAAEIDEGRHIAFVGILQGIFLSCLGWTVFKRLSFPILYLWLLVPTGGFIVPTLQTIATRIAETLIRWAGIPVFVDRYILEVPTGTYFVAPGCAGLNFLLAMLAIAPLYAYLLYRPAWKRILAVLLGLALAIVMNGVRIAAIIIIAHWSDRRLNIVDDHLLYGWGFFVIVLFAAGCFGLLFADRRPDFAPEGAAPAPPQPPAGVRSRTAWAGGLAILAVASCVIYGRIAETAFASQASALSLALPTEIQGWRNAAPSGDWSPSYSNADILLHQAYSQDKTTVDVFIAYYARQTPGHEMIAYDNRIVDAKQWRVVRAERLEIDAGTAPLPVTSLVVESVTRRRVVWMLFWVDERFASQRMAGKLLQARAKLTFGDPRAAMVAFSTPDDGEPGSARLRLEAFLKAFPPLGQFLAAARPLVPPASAAPAR